MNNLGVKLRAGAPEQLKHRVGRRSPLAMRLVMASLCAIGLRIAGYGVAGAAQNQPLLLPLFYLIPLGGACLAALVLAGYSPAAILARRKPLEAA